MSEGVAFVRVVVVVSAAVIVTPLIDDGGRRFKAFDKPCPVSVFI